MISTPPPGANGTIILMALSGNAACAGSGANDSIVKIRIEMGANPNFNLAADARMMLAPASWI
jgi:hypothetical protein